MISNLLEKVIKAESLKELEEIEKEILELDPNKVKLTYSDAIKLMIEKVGTFFNAEVVQNYIPYVSKKKVSYPKVKEDISSIKLEDIKDCLDVYKHKDFVLCMLKVLAKKNKTINKIYEDYKEKNKTTVVFITNVLKEKRTQKS